MVVGAEVTECERTGSAPVWWPLAEAATLWAIAAHMAGGGSTSSDATSARGGAVVLQLGPAGGAAADVGLDGLALGRGQRVEGQDGQLVVRMFRGGDGHATTPCASRATRRLRSPDLMRLFTVPSGWPSISAASR